MMFMFSKFRSEIKISEWFLSNSIRIPFILFESIHLVSFIWIGVSGPLVSLNVRPRVLCACENALMIRAFVLVLSA